MKTFPWFSTAILVLIMCGTASVFSDQEKVEELSLKIKDLRGRDLLPFKLDGAKASAFFFLTQDCPISNRYAPEIQRIVRDYQERRIRFYLVYVDPTAEKREIENHLHQYGFSQLTAIQDLKHSLVKATGVTVTPEVAVIGDNGEIHYRGRIDNAYAALGKPRRKITEHNLRDALDAIINGRKVILRRTEAIGCFINSEN